MNGVHDMGGMHGFGPVAPEAHEPVFHAPWEARVLAMTLAAGAWGRWTLDELRHARERIPPADYLSMSYYERWLAALVDLLTRHGLISAAEAEAGVADPGSPTADPPLKAQAVASILAKGGPSLRPSTKAASFALGQMVRARNLNPAGHTRLPRYLRGRAGRVTAFHGAHVLPDANAHGLGEQPQALYQVRFEASELFGPQGEAGSAVYADLWEGYLDAA